MQNMFMYSDDVSELLNQRYKDGPYEFSVVLARDPKNNSEWRIMLQDDDEGIFAISSDTYKTHELAKAAIDKWIWANGYINQPVQ